MKLIPGNSLHPTQREQAEDMFPNRLRIIGKGEAYRNDDDWFNAHAFWAFDDGCMAMNVGLEEYRDLAITDRYSPKYMAHIEENAMRYMTRWEMIEEIQKLRGIEND